MMTRSSAGSTAMSTNDKDEHRGKSPSSDRLRRLAIQNSYATHSGPPGNPHPHSGNDKILPPIHGSRPPVTSRPGVRTQSPLLDVDAASRRRPRAFSSNDLRLLRRRRVNVDSRGGSQYHQGGSSGSGVEIPGPVRQTSSYSTVAIRPSVRGSSQMVRPPPAPAPPCSTTALDFHRRSIRQLQREIYNGTGSRIDTPRGNNPHPVGLVFQSPYNRHRKVDITPSSVC